MYVTPTRLRLVLEANHSEVACSLYANESLLAEHRADAPYAARCELASGLNLSLQRLFSNPLPTRAALVRFTSQCRTLTAWLGDHTLAALADFPRQTVRLNLPASLCTIPWELAIQKESSMGMQHQVGRIVATDQAFSSASHLASSSLSPSDLSLEKKMLVFANPEFNLLGAELEASVVKHRLRRRSERVATDVHFDRTDATQFLQLVSNYDWLHFAGHAAKAVFEDTPSEISQVSQSKVEEIRLWRLGFQSLEPTNLRENLARLPRFVFANACGSAHVHAQNPRDSMVLTWLECGTQHYIGTLGKQQDQEARQVATEFYEAIIDGYSIGQALHAARKNLAKRGEWLANNYVLYGEPEQLLLPLLPSEDHRPDQSLAPQSKMFSLTTTHDLQFPLVCNQCQHAIASRFLLATTPIGSSQHGPQQPLCIYCAERLSQTHATPAVNVPALTAPAANVNVETLSTTPSVGPTLTVTTTSPKVHVDSFNGKLEGWLSFCKRWQAAVENLCVCEPGTGLIAEVHWTTHIQSNNLPVTAAAKDSPIRTWGWGNSFARRPKSATTCLAMRFIVLEGEGALPDSVAQVCRQDWHHQLRSSGAPEVPQVLVVASMSGWDLATELAALSPVGDAMGLALIDVPMSMCHYNKAHLNCAAVEPFWRTWQKQWTVEEVIAKLEARLPLAESLQAHEISRELAAPVDIVLIAFRWMVHRHQLNLDHLKKYGWILSQPKC